MKGTAKSGKGRFFVTLLLVLLLIVGVLTISVTIGAVNVSAGDIGKILVNKISGKDIFRIAWEGKTENIIWNIRFPRVLMAFIVGAGLALCGVLMQALTKNPWRIPMYLASLPALPPEQSVPSCLAGSASWAGIRLSLELRRERLSPSVCLSALRRSMAGLPRRSWFWRVSRLPPCSPPLPI